MSSPTSGEETTIDVVDGIRFGTYGYRHMELHKFGSVDELRKVSNRDCCDNKGECRVTEMKWVGDVAFYRHAEEWCEVTVPINIIDLPRSVSATVCATFHVQNDGKGMCPTAVYCAGIEGGV